jgi:hypothetical protein
MKLTQFLRRGTDSKTTGTQYVKGKPSADAKVARDEFLARRKTVKKDRGERKLTPLQRRMQSGGPA